MSLLAIKLTLLSGADCTVVRGWFFLMTATVSAPLTELESRNEVPGNTHTEWTVYATTKNLISAHPKGAGGPILRLHYTFDMVVITNYNCGTSNWLSE